VIEAQDASYYYGDPGGRAHPRPLDQRPARHGSPGERDPGGQPVTWTYLVTNTGKSTLTGVAITDDHGVAVSCPRSSLAAAPR